MNEILNKLSSYNLFNYLLPGAVFVFIASKIANRDLIQGNVFLQLLLYYFIGLVISRVGSLLIEPILKKILFLKFADYKDFVEASSKDAKIEVLSEANNTYRTLCSMFAMTLLVKPYIWAATVSSLLANWSTTILCLLLLVVFAFSYRKQTAYITKRIRANLSARS
jgi:hypothetical protein